MRKILFFFIIGSSAALCSCATNYYKIIEDPVPGMNPPEPEISRVIFIRPGSGASGGWHIRLYDQDTIIAALPSSSYFTYDTMPGRHIFASMFFHNIDFLAADLKGGKTYYVFCSRYVQGISDASKILAIKKDLDLMQKLSGWLPELKKSELTQEGAIIMKARKDEKGNYLIFKPGAVEFRVDIENARKKWLEQLRTTKNHGYWIQTAFSTNI